MRKLVILTFILIWAVPSIANAKTITDDYVGCVSKQALNEFTTAAINKDYRQMSALLNKTCFQIKGREFSVVKAGFVKSQIRVYAGSGSVVLWVPSEAAR